MQRFCRVSMHLFCHFEGFVKTVISLLPVSTGVMLLVSCSLLATLSQLYMLS